ncbi:MAG: TRAP transporter substrate-binding protein DctP, partial [Candidatus Tectomicrobia bacterium]|nr:TRAP transporter substrate-binding protein DctP [Candidatus Tectomicrobia bacterium]
TFFAPEGTLYWKVLVEPLVEKVKVLTDGKVIIKPYPSGVLAGVFEGHKAVLDGRADMAFHYPPFEVVQNPPTAFLGNLPGGMGSEAKLIWLKGGGGYELWKEYRRSQGLHGLFCALTGSEVFAHSHKRVQKLADLKGLRYRTAGANTWVMKRIGAAPVLVPGPDVFPLLERKGIDATEYIDPANNYQLGFHRVAKYVIYPGIHASTSNDELLMKKATWDSFPPDIQKKLELACDSVVLEGYAQIQRQNALAMKSMAESGSNEMVELDKEVVEAVRQAGREWVEEKIKEEKKKGTNWMERFSKSYYEFMDLWTKNNGFQVIDRK